MHHEAVTFMVNNDDFALLRSPPKIWEVSHLTPSVEALLNSSIREGMRKNFAVLLRKAYVM